MAIKAISSCRAVKALPHASNIGEAAGDAGRFSFIFHPDLNRADSGVYKTGTRVPSLDRHAGTTGLPSPMFPFATTMTLCRASGSWLAAHTVPRFAKLSKYLGPGAACNAFSIAAGAIGPGAEMPLV